MRAGVWVTFVVGQVVEGWEDAGGGLGYIHDVCSGGRGGRLGFRRACCGWVRRRERGETTRAKPGEQLTANSPTSPHLTPQERWTGERKDAPSLHRTGRPLLLLYAPPPPATPPTIHATCPSAAHAPQCRTHSLPAAVPASDDVCRHARRRQLRVHTRHHAARGCVRHTTCHLLAATRRHGPEAVIHAW